MGAQERAAAAVSTMERIRREMAERRELRQRHSAEIRERMRAGLARQVPMLEQAAKEQHDVARRRQAAGGWATASIDGRKTHLMGLGVPDDGPPRPAYHPPAAAAPVGPAPETATPRPPRRPTRPPVTDDEDDFSTHTWMTNR